MVGCSLRVLRLLPPLKTGHYDIAEILLRVALNTKHQINHIVQLPRTHAVLVIGLYELLGNPSGSLTGTPAFSTTKTGRHEIAEILLQVALSTINQINQSNLKNKYSPTVNPYKYFN
jgi:hypothetical protein